ncbi:MAG: DegT/DnrJ/EryC1/StrS family aminotransferase [Armatimonadota bacterium]|nr:DegT/DnrJ/EryC1/StrS family aminotransferase [Armatimonadota bacterium]
MAADVGLDADTGGRADRGARPAVTGRRFYPVAAPVLAGNEEAYVLDCLRTTWISSNGGYIGRFEAAFAQFCGARHALACSNGTVALHLALLALGIGPGDEVLVPAVTFVATANAVTYCGARPVFVDVDPDTWGIDPTDLETRITSRARAVIVVHLYGHPADMDAVRAVARRRGLAVVEDAAEAHGATYRGQPVGALADVGTFSFYGNKIITTGEGGMVVTNDDALAARISQLKGQGMDPNRRYWFTMIGYNYRLTNIAAAIGLAQLENADWHTQRRREVAAWYQQELAGVRGLTWHAEQSWARHAYWMFTIQVDPAVADRDTVMARLADQGIETRPVFYPLHMLPPYRTRPDARFPVAERVASRGINLPTWAGLTRDDVGVIACAVRESLRR